MALGQYGTFSRNTPRLRVGVGFKGDSEANFTDALPPVASSGILSGQLIIKVTSGGAWFWQQATESLVDTAIAAGGAALAFAYFDATDPAVLAANSLPGLLCNGKFEVETPFYDSNTYLPGVSLGASTTAGNVTLRASGKPQIGLAGSDPITGLSLRNLLGTYPNLEYNSETDGSGSTWRTTQSGQVLIVQTAYQAIIS